MEIVDIEEVGAEIMIVGFLIRFEHLDIWLDHTAARDGQYCEQEKHEFQLLGEFLKTKTP